MTDIHLALNAKRVKLSCSPALERAFSDCHRSTSLNHRLNLFRICRSILGRDPHRIAHRGFWLNSRMLAGKFRFHGCTTKRLVKSART